MPRGLQRLRLAIVVVAISPNYREIGVVDGVDATVRANREERLQLGFSIRHGLLGCDTVIWGKEAIRYCASSLSTVSSSTDGGADCMPEIPPKNRVRK
jgi:hypothetical protein